MFIDSANGHKYLIRRGPSIFTNRNNAAVKKQDCFISKRCPTPAYQYGSREADGARYNGIARLACESGEFLRSHEALPPEITPEFLKAAGFLDD